MEMRRIRILRTWYHLRVVVFFFSATMYSRLPNRVLKAAITNVGTLMENKLTTKRSGYSKSLSKLSFSSPYRILFDLLFMIS